MSSEKTRGIIYQIIKYSEKSAICFAFTEDKGKLKFLYLMPLEKVKPF